MVDPRDDDDIEERLLREFDERDAREALEAAFARTMEAALRRELNDLPRHMNPTAHPAASPENAEERVQGWVDEHRLKKKQDRRAAKAVLLPPEPPRHR